jgi:ribosomal protein S18 acetylase RimI-like enzyme
VRDLRLLSSEADHRAAAALAAGAHAALRARRPFLPARESLHFLPRIAWVAERGPVLGAWEGGELAAFLGGFRLDNYRNEGPGTLAPDWCHGVAAGVEEVAAIRELYRELAPRWLRLAGRIHAICTYDGEEGVHRALELTGFGRFVLDAARPARELRELLGTPRTAAAFSVRRAGPQDAEALARLDTGLAAHIAASPIYMPETRSRGPSAWRAWFDEPKAVAWLAERGGKALGFLKAQEPQLDVSHVVHGPRTLAINGAFVTEDARRLGVAYRLLLELARFAEAGGDELVSVDCETLNLEALAFWTRYFLPVGWSLERRLPAPPSR